MLDIYWTAIDELTPNGRNARTHSRKQIRQIADSIAAFGFVVPILIDDRSVIIAGHGRHAAAKPLGLKEVPTIKVTGLSPAKRRALSPKAPGGIASSLQSSSPTSRRCW
jgi:ParB-like chromosome segregation protein Spo0J